MILTLVSISLLVIGIIICILYDYYINADYALYVIGFILAVIGGIGSTICIGLILCKNINVDNTIKIYRIEYEALIDRVELIDEDTDDFTKSEIIKDISKWNQSVIGQRYNFENPWLNWFTSKEFTESLQYIDVEIK